MILNIQQQIIDNNSIFPNIDIINIINIHRTLKKNNISMKNLDNIIILVGCKTPSTIINP